MDLNCIQTAVSVEPVQNSTRLQGSRDLFSKISPHTHTSTRILLPICRPTGRRVRREMKTNKTFIAYTMITDAFLLYHRRPLGQRTLLRVLFSPRCQRLLVPTYTMFSCIRNGSRFQRP